MKLIMGDQSPWVRGLLRLQAVKLLFPASETVYFWHDGDQSWVSTGNYIKPSWYPRIKSSDENEDEYASIMIETLLPEDDSVRQTLCTLCKFDKKLFHKEVLLGPPDPPIIAYGEELLLPIITKKIDTINKWYQYIGEYIGEYIGGVPLPEPKHGDNKRPLLNWIKKISGCPDEIYSLVEFFKNQRININIPLWAISREGKRRPYNILDSNSLLIPKRDGIVRYFTERGWIFVGTRIPYLKPDIDYLQIHLEIVEEDHKKLEDTVWELYRKKKESSGKPLKPRPTKLLPRKPNFLSKLALGYRVRAWTNDGREVIF